MSRLAPIALAVLFASGCSRRTSTPQVDAERTVACDPVPVCPQAIGPDDATPPGWDALRARWLTDAGANLDLAEVNIAVAQQWDGTIDARESIARVDRVAADVRARFPTSCDARCRFETLRAHLFERLLLRAEIDPTGMYRDIRRSLIPYVLREGVGYCEGIAYLMVSLGDRLDLRLEIVPERQHVNVRFTPERGPSIDVDPTLAGTPAQRSDDPTGCVAAAGVYGVPMSRREAVGMMLGALAGRAGPFRRRWLDEAVDLAPRSPQVRNNRGVEREAQMDLHGALEDYRAAGAMDSCVPFPFANDARVLARLGETAAATATVNALRVLGAQRADAEWDVSLALAEAEIAVESGDDRTADAAFLRALRAAPGTWAISAQIGRARQAQGRYREAADAWHSAATESSDPSLRLAWIESLVEAGAIHDASEALRALERDRPAVPHWTMAHAMVAAAEGRLVDARRAARTCLERGGIGCARALLVLADVCRREGNTTCARRYDAAFLSCQWPVPARRLRTLSDETRRRLANEH